MADRISNYATTAGFIVGLGVLLFVVRSRRPKEARPLFLVVKTTREEKSGMIPTASPFMINICNAVLWAVVL